MRAQSTLVMPALTRTVYDLEADLAATNYRAAMTFLRAEMRARSLLVVFTNLLEPRSAKLAASLKGLLPHHERRRESY